MKIAICSDIHSNSSTLKRFVKDARVMGASKFFSLGDMVGAGRGESPQEVISIIRSSFDLALLGNHDSIIAGVDPLAWFGDDKGYLVKKILSDKAKLCEEDLAWIGRLDSSVVLGNMCFIHAHPFNARWEFLATLSDAQTALACVQAKYIFCGHTHMGALYKKDNLLEELKQIEVKLEQPYFLGESAVCNVGSLGCRQGDKSDYGVWVMLDQEKMTVTYYHIEF